MSLPRLAYGALAGIAATTAMTVAMRRLHRALPEAERAPLPPREIVGAMAEDTIRGRGAPTALFAHFAFGAGTGALYALQPRRSAATGISCGLAVWAVSYLGWVPAAGLVKPATRHAPRRNTLMIAVHVVWGAVLALGLREIEAADRDAFRRGTRPLPDVRQHRPGGTGAAPQAQRSVSIGPSARPATNWTR